MFTLAIDTSTPTLVVGIVADGTARAQRMLPDCREHNEKLVLTVQECLAEAGIDFTDLTQVVVGCGPGPFTGLRVGMASAQAFADALNIPIKGVCSLDAIAMSTGAMVVATDARRREVYWATYDEHGQRIGEPAVGSPDSVTGEFSLVSVPAHLSDKLAAVGPRVDGVPDPVSLVAAPEIALAPLYLRRPDAKPPRPRPQSPALAGFLES